MGFVANTEITDSQFVTLSKNVNSVSDLGVETNNMPSVLDSKRP